LHLERVACGEREIRESNGSLASLGDRGGVWYGVKKVVMVMSFSSVSVGVVWDLYWLIRWFLCLFIPFLFVRLTRPTNKNKNK
jgi:hypothetical protein